MALGIKPWVVLLSALALTACGGGDDDNDSTDTGVQTSTGDPVDPTAVPLEDSSTTANSLATEASKAIETAERIGTLPGGVSLQTAALPGGVTTTVNCDYGGSYSYDYPDNFQSNSSYQATYNNCSYYSGYTINGHWTYTWLNVSGSTWDYSYNYQMTITGPNNYSESVSASQSCTWNSASAEHDCSIQENNRSYGESFEYANGTLNGSYSWSNGSYGTVTVTFSNWTATSGTASFSGPNGFSATVVRTGANSYNVTINNGVTRTIVLS